MKAYSRVLLLCSLFSNAWQAAAFLVRPQRTPSVPLRSSYWSSTENTFSDPLEIFPTDMQFKRIQGGDTLTTYHLPVDTDRCQYVLKTNGRPMKAKIQLWLGPLRQTHGMEIDIEDGRLTPFRATLKYKKGGQTLKVSTSSTFEFPMDAAVFVPGKERASELKAITEKVWDESPKTLIQGGSVNGGVGAVRTFEIDKNVESVQILFWSRDTGKKSLKAKIEVIQGPNQLKQEYDLQCGGGSQPYHCIVQTPGDRVTVRVYNKKFVEDGLLHCVLVPYTFKPAPPEGQQNRQWWE